MMNNSTSSANPFARVADGLWIYVLQGLCLFIGNSIIVAAIMFHRLLRERKEYALPAALAFCDAVDGIGATLAGFGRWYLFSTDKALSLVSRWHCMWSPWMVCWHLSSHLNDSTMLAISVDHLIAIGWPLFHFGLFRSYGMMLVLIAWGPNFVRMAISFYLSYQHQQPEVEAICFGHYAFDPVFQQVTAYLRVVLALGSVLLYIPVIILFRLRKDPATNSIQKEHIASQRKFTITLGISCLFTTIFFVIPLLIQAVIGMLIFDSDLVSIINIVAYVSENINKMANIFLYSLRHRNLRLGIVMLLRRKQLTEQIIKNGIGPAPAPVQVQAQAAHVPAAAAFHAATPAAATAALAATPAVTPILVPTPVPVAMSAATAVPIVKPATAPGSSTTHDAASVHIVAAPTHVALGPMPSTSAVYLTEHACSASPKMEYFPGMDMPGTQFL